MKHFLTACFVMLLASCSPSAVEKAESPKTVQTHKVQPYTSTAARSFPFISKPKMWVELSFQVGGQLATLNAYPGSFYRKGEVIAAIDSSDYAIAARRAKAVYAQAKAEHARIAALYQKGNISGSSHDKAKADLAIAKAAYDAAQNQLHYTQLIAPFDGYVQRVAAEQHQDVRPIQPIVSFIDLSQIKIEASIPESIASAEESITSISACFDAIPAETFPAELVEISRSTGTNNTSFLLTALISNQTKGLELLGGMTGSLRIDVAERQAQALAIPVQTVCNRPSLGSFVWVINSDGRANAKKITTGTILSNGMVEVTSGLMGEEVIATTGLDQLYNGILVIAQ
ncbi:MAG: efflux RND transporter periplasmic adaptor subunit [Tenuifilaceae bacterium]|nr:efflux RND transporter periplasmic adaptor subunit [Tenuifilaceae bacterium]